MRPNGAIAALMMLRKYRYKLINCEADPPQLFDYKVHPNELHNLTDSPNRTETLSALI